jgi:hypothetical protein
LRAGRALLRRITLFVFWYSVKLETAQSPWPSVAEGLGKLKNNISFVIVFEAA